MPQSLYSVIELIGTSPTALGGGGQNRNRARRRNIASFALRKVVVPTRRQSQPM